MKATISNKAAPCPGGKVNRQFRASRRNARAKPPLAALRAWRDQRRRRLSGKTALGRAFQYALGRWEALTRYIDDGRLSIDNNLSERLLRGIAVTRKSFLFVGSDLGGERAAVLYTLIESAKLNGLDAEAYLATVLSRMAQGHRASRLAELLPWVVALRTPVNPCVICSAALDTAASSREGKVRLRLPIRRGLESNLLRAPVRAGPVSRVRYLVLISRTHSTLRDAQTCRR
jgi:hypothetical protein